MGRKGQAPEQIIAKLREAEVSLAKGKTVAKTCRVLGGCEQTFYRWRSEYGVLKVDQAKKLRPWNVRIPG
ncbi:transposase [Humidesulfovibrio idahonensis]